MQTTEQLTTETTTEDSAAIVELNLQDLGLIGGGYAMPSML